MKQTEERENEQVTEDEDENPARRHNRGRNVLISTNHYIQSLYATSTEHGFTDLL